MRIERKLLKGGDHFWGNDQEQIRKIENETRQKKFCQNWNARITLLKRSSLRMSILPCLPGVRLRLLSPRGSS